MIKIKHATTIIEGTLATILNTFEAYDKELLGVFTDEAILFAYIEYAKCYREYSEIGRIQYLYEKAYLYDHGKDPEIKEVYYDDYCEMYRVVLKDLFNP